MKRLSGKVIEMNLRDTIQEEYGNKKITLNVYSIKIDTEKDYLLTKRDVNIKNEILNKTISYYKNKEGWIYKSKILKK